MKSNDSLIIVTQNGDGKVTNKDKQNVLQKSIFKDPPGTRQDEYVKEAKRPDRPPPKTDLKVGDSVVADTSKEDYPGGHKERRGKVTRIGQQGVHIKTADSDEHEWHPYKIVKKVSESSTPKPDHPWRKSVPKSPKNKGLYKKDQPGQLTRTPRKSTGKKLDKYLNYLSTQKEATELNERGMDVGHQRSQAQKHLAAYTRSIQQGNYVQAQKHYQKYVLHKSTLQKAKKTV